MTRKLGIYRASAITCVLASTTAFAQTPVQAEKDAPIATRPWATPAPVAPVDIIPAKPVQPAQQNMAPAYRDIVDWGRSRPIYALSLDNDSFGQGTDRHYTSGMRVEQIRTGARGLLNWAVGANRQDVVHAERRIAVGQQMFTPERKRRVHLQSDDRPYAGWLFASYEQATETYIDERRAAVDVGVVGPMSLAGETQNIAHKLMGVRNAAAWNTQESNAVGVLAQYSYVRRQQLGPVLNVAAQSYWGVAGAAGNIRTSASLGAGVRLGRVENAGGGASLFSPGRIDRFARNGRNWYVFGSGRVEGVARDGFLQGVGGHASHTVRAKPVVVEYQTGYTAQFGRQQWQASLVRRSEQFVGQRGPDAYMSFSYRLTR